MLVPFKNEDIIISDIVGIYLDSNNASKVRVFIGGNLVGVAQTFELDEEYNMYRVYLFKHYFPIPMSATNCSPLSIKVYPKNPYDPMPNVWLKVEGSYYATFKGLKEFPFTLMDGQSSKLIASQQGRDRYLLVYPSTQDRSFESDEEYFIQDIVTTYQVAFRSEKNFTQFFASAFTKSLPYLDGRTAVDIMMKHENKPLEECLRAIWQDYQNTYAYKKTLTL